MKMFILVNIKVVGIKSTMEIIGYLASENAESAAQEIGSRIMNPAQATLGDIRITLGKEWMLDEGSSDSRWILMETDIEPIKGRPATMC